LGWFFAYLCTEFAHLAAPTGMISLQIPRKPLGNKTFRDFVLDTIEKR
jgi:hypothetical protein